MYIATAESAQKHTDIASIFPPDIKKCFLSINLDEAQEIRLIRGQPIVIHYCDGDYYVHRKGVLAISPRGGIVITKSDIDYIMERISKSSLYSVKDELKYGYITISGGHRIGIAGTAVVKDNRVEFIKNVSAMNIRIADEIIGISHDIVKKITRHGLVNTLIISPPACGKTTLLRDMGRELSEMGYCVGIADERCEIAAMYDGKAGFDIGPRTVVMEACPKSYAMECIMRTMSPNVIVTDELGQEEDVRAVYNTINSGVSVIATAHGKDTKQLMKREVFRTLVPLFDIIIVLSKRNGAGTVESVINNE